MIDFDSIIDRNGTYSTQWDYIEDRFGSSDIIPFSISDMDFAVSSHIMKALNERMAHPIFGYSRWKHDDYLESIVGWYHNRLDTTIDKNWIIYSPSVMYSLSRFIELLSETGDGILMFTPAYNAFFDLIENMDRILVTSTLHNHLIDYEDIETKIKEVKILLLCNPHNPTGKLYSPDELEYLIGLAYKHDVWIISDDIHMDIVFNGKMTPILKLHQDKIVIASSISKTFNTPSLGGSYVIIPDPKLNEAFSKITRYRDFVNSPAILSVVATIAAYHDETWLNALLTYLHLNRKYIQTYLEENIPELRLEPSEATYLAWINTQGLGISDELFGKYLVEYGKIGIMSGSIYGMEGYLRLNFGCPRAKLEEGLKRLKNTVVYIKSMKEE